jgi:hypothetical protein
LQPID